MNSAVGELIREYSNASTCVLQPPGSFPVRSALTPRGYARPVDDEPPQYLVQRVRDALARDDRVGELGGVDVPMIAVLGNHDHHSDEVPGLRATLERAGVQILESETTFVDVDGTCVGIAGTKGFGGGFANACASDFGEPEMKAFIEH